MRNSYDPRIVDQKLRRQSWLQAIGFIVFFLACFFLFVIGVSDNKSHESRLFYGAALGMLLGLCVLSYTILYVGKRLAKALELFAGVVVAGVDRAAANRGERAISDDVRFNNDI